MYQLPLALTHADDLPNPCDCLTWSIEAYIDLLDGLGRDLNHVFHESILILLIERARTP